MGLGSEQLAQLFSRLVTVSARSDYPDVKALTPEKEETICGIPPWVDLSVARPDVLGIPESKIGSLRFTKLSSL